MSIIGNVAAKVDIILCESAVNANPLQNIHNLVVQ